MSSEKQETSQGPNPIFLNRNQVPTILAIGAHPDDIEVGCGGTLKVLADLGYKVYGVILTDGERGGERKETKRSLHFCKSFRLRKHLF